MDMNFDQYLTTLENIPPEVERNFKLIKELDETTQELVGRIEECMLQFKNSNSRSDRNRIKQNTRDLFDKIDSYAEDKVRLTEQTYDLVNGHIIRLSKLADCKIDPDNQFTIPPGFDMPPDPNEPKFCICGQIGYGEMIACDNRECEIEWFHYACVNITEPPGPSEKWYCGSCLPLMKAQARRFSKQSRSKTKRRRR